MLVEVGRELAQRMVLVPLTDDGELVQALPADRTDEPQDAAQKTDVILQRI